MSEVGESTTRLLEAVRLGLRGAERVAHVGVSRQRLHELIARLLASGHLTRVGHGRYRVTKAKYRGAVRRRGRDAIPRVVGPKPRSA